MKTVVALFVLVLLAGCSREEQDRARAQAERAREQARQTAGQLKHDSKEVLRQAGNEAHKASAELNRDLE
ncbi:MAG TPA: hypothetical protein VHC72_10735, partial [Bryobacteraceae bacterium]|nr:hypothetical protein [Bryobacteraceae bacterium]